MNHEKENILKDMAFCHLEENLEINTDTVNMDRLIDTVIKKVMDVAKTASKEVFQTTAEATGDLIGNKIADKITSVGKSKNN